MGKGGNIFMLRLKTAAHILATHSARNTMRHMLTISTWVCGVMAFVDNNYLYDKLHSIQPGFFYPTN